MHQNAFGGWVPSGPAGGANSIPPDPLAGYSGRGIPREGEREKQREGREEKRK